MRYNVTRTLLAIVIVAAVLAYFLGFWTDSIWLLVAVTATASVLRPIRKEE